MAPIDLAQDLLRVAKAFARAQLPFMVVGAFATMIHGAPRTTRDLDIVVHLSMDHQDKVEPVLHDLAISGLSERRDEFGQRLVGALPSGLVLEVFFTPPHPLLDREYARRHHVDFEGVPLPVIAPEDLVLRKLVNTRLRRGLDFDDAVGVLAVQGDGIDLTYLRAHCGVHRVCGLLEEALREAARAAAEG